MATLALVVISQTILLPILGLMLIKLRREHFNKQVDKAVVIELRRRRWRRR